MHKYMRWRKFPLKIEPFLLSQCDVRRRHKLSHSSNGGKCGQKGHQSGENFIQVFFFAESAYQVKIPKCPKFECNVMLGT